MNSFISIDGLGNLNETINEFAGVFDMVEEQVNGITGNMGDIDKQIADVKISSFYDIIENNVKVYI